MVVSGGGLKKRGVGCRFCCERRRRRMEAEEEEEKEGKRRGKRAVGRKKKKEIRKKGRNELTSPVREKGKEKWERRKKEREK